MFRAIFIGPPPAPTRPARPASEPPRPIEPTKTPRPSRYPTREDRARKAQVLCARAKERPGTTLSGKCYVIDGDTIVIKHTHIRLAGIDAPELDQPFGQASKWALVRMVKGQEITAEVQCDMSYDRVVATCRLPDGRDIAGELVRQGLALDWATFSKGKYAALEPDGVRRKLWKTHARQGSRDTPAGQRASRANG